MTFLNVTQRNVGTTKPVVERFRFLKDDEFKRLTADEQNEYVKAALAEVERLRKLMQTKKP